MFCLFVWFMEGLPFQSVYRCLTASMLAAGQMNWLDESVTVGNLGTAQDPGFSLVSFGQCVTCDKENFCKSSLDEAAVMLYVMSAFSSYMSVCHVCVWCPWSPEEGVESSGIVLQVVVRCHVGPGPLLSHLSNPLLKLFKIFLLCFIPCVCVCVCVCVCTCMSIEVRVQRTPTISGCGDSLNLELISSGVWLAMSPGDPPVSVSLVLGYSARSCAWLLYECGRSELGSSYLCNRHFTH